MLAGHSGPVLADVAGDHAGDHAERGVAACVGESVEHVAQVVADERYAAGKFVFRDVEGVVDRGQERDVGAEPVQV